MLVMTHVVTMAMMMFLPTSLPHVVDDYGDEDNDDVFVYLIISCC